MERAALRCLAILKLGNKVELNVEWKSDFTCRTKEGDSVVSTLESDLAEDTIMGVHPVRCLSVYIEACCSELRWQFALTIGSDSSSG